MNLENGKIETNKLFFLFLVFTISVLLADIMTFIKDNLGISINFFIIIVLLLIPLTFFLLKRYFTFTSIKLNKVDILCIAFLLFLTAVTLPFPDSAYDTINYHIFLQYPSFNTSLDNSFFPGGISTFFFPLADRMFYVFYTIFGYRAGTILNTLIIILLYFQIKNLLIIYFDRKGISIKKNILNITSLLIISTEFILANLTIYYTDLFAIPFTIELFRIIVFKDNYEYNNKKTYYIAFLSGIAIALKLTNIIFVGPLILYYIYKNWRHIKISAYCISSIAFLLPATIYFIYSFIKTGNPVFPFYNGIFKSPYYAAANFTQDSFGPKSIIEYLIWPVYILFKPGRTAELAHYSGRLGQGFLIAIWFLCTYKLSKKYNIKKIVPLVIIFLISILMWEYTTGYIRYASYLEILAGILIIIISLQYINSNSRIFKTIGIVFIFALIAQCFISIYFILGRNMSWSWKPSVFSNTQLYLDNAKMVGRDRVNTNLKNDIKNVDLWIIGLRNGGYASAINRELPMIQFNLWWISNESTPEAIDTFNKLINKYKDKKLYTLIRSEQYNDAYTEFKKIGYDIKNLKQIKHPFIPVGDSLSLLEVSKSKPDNTVNVDSSVNLLADGSFENILNNASKVWSVPNIDDQVVKSVNAEDKDYYVRASVDKSITQFVSVKAGTIYKFSFYSKIENINNSKTRMQVNWFKGNKYIDCSISIVDSTDKWQKHEVALNPPVGADHAMVYINSADKYYIDFDNAYLSEVPKQ